MQFGLQFGSLGEAVFRRVNDFLDFIALSAMIGGLDTGGAQHVVGVLDTSFTAVYALGGLAQGLVFSVPAKKMLINSN